MLTREHCGDFRATARRALRELSLPVRRHAADFTPEELVVVVVSYEKAYDECWIQKRKKEGIKREEEKEVEKKKDQQASNAGRTRRAPLRDDGSGGGCGGGGGGDEAAWELDLRDQCSVTNQVLHVLAREVLSRPGDFTPDDLGFVADACARFTVHPRGEDSTWSWPMLIAQQRRQRAGVNNDEVNATTRDTISDAGERGGRGSDDKRWRRVVDAPSATNDVSMDEDEM